MALGAIQEGVGTQEESQELIEVFRRFDTSGDGLISRDELADVFQAVDPVHWTEENIDQIMRACDVNGDGNIDYLEFVAWLMHGGSEWDDAKNMAQLEGDNSHMKRTRDSRAFVNKECLVEMQVETSRKSKLGCKLASPQTLAIKSIDPDGLFAEWNDKNRRQQVSPGDRIISVNGFTAQKEILKELRKIGKLTIVLRPAAGTQRYQLHVDDAYEWSDVVIDEGKLACVRRARNLKTNHEVVVKSVHKRNTTPEKVDLAILALKCLDHINIVKLYDVFEDYLEWHLVLQYCSGGEVFEKILAETVFSETQAARIQQQIFSAVAYMHSKGFCHRDLKPENLLLEEPCDLEKCVIKIIDWHSCRKFTSSTERFLTLVGTPEFTACEVVKGLPYTCSCDYWSAGCLMYFMLAGYPPFCGENDAETIEFVRRGMLAFPAEEFSFVSDQAKDLLAALIRTTPESRCTAEQAIHHPWIVTYGTRLAEKALSLECKRMKEYMSKSKFAKQALFVCSRYLSSENLQELKHSFDLLDANKDGMITYVELKTGIEKMGTDIDMRPFKALFESLDVQGTKKIEWSEFVAATVDARNLKDEESLWKAFQVFDHDRNGTISKAEIAALMEDGLTKEIIGDAAVERVLADNDTNGDGVLDFHEFVAMVRGHEYSDSF